MNYVPIKPESDLISEYNDYYDYDEDAYSGKVENINNVSTIIPVICFHAGYNKACKGQNIYRVYNWYDIYNLISNGKIL